MRKYRSLGAAVIALMLAVTVCASIRHGCSHGERTVSAYSVPLPPAPLEQDPLSHIGEAFSVDPDFTSHLPIVILDTNGIEPPVNSRLDAAQGRFVNIDGIEPYVDGTMELICGESGVNSLRDTPSVTSAIRIKRRGNSSMLYEKGQWLVKLVTGSGQYNDVDLLGMGPEHEWILNGSMFDKSMLRNYLAYSIASEFLPYTPDNHYCEVISRNGDTYTYQGVYLMGESIKQGADRVNIADYTVSRAFNSYLVRRDRLDDDAVTLETYGRLNGFSAEYLALLYPNKHSVTADTVHYVEQDISAIEQILYSDDPEVFAAYPRVIDVDSFVDYFLLNEFFASYDSGNFSTYFYKDLGGKLCMGPVWDYDGTMDNYLPEGLKAEHTALQTKPWFDRLCRDRTFLERLERRYAQLRRGSLSEAHVMERTDEIIQYLGVAQEREWARWGHWYATQNKYSLLDEVREDGTVVHRNASTYQDEIYRLKTALRAHGNSIPEALKALQRSAPVSTGLNEWMGWLLLLAAFVFFAPAVYVGFRK